MAVYVLDPEASLCHWYVGVGVPVATTVNVAVAGAVTVAFIGWVVIVGVAGVGFTVSVAAVLVTVPAELVTTHSYCVPLLAVVVAGVV